MHKEFNSKDQQQFAILSGDYNPMHVDALYARRAMFGSQVVHGINILLWTLDSWSRLRELDFSLTNLKVSFKKAVTIDTKIEVRVIREEERSVKMEVFDAGNVAMKVDFKWESGKSNLLYEKTNPNQDISKQIEEGDILNAKGALNVFCNPILFEEIYPSLNRYASVNQFASIIGSSKIIGMECPGLHSVYSSLNVEFNKIDALDQKLSYSVASFDERFNMVGIEASSNLMKMDILAFQRPKPFVQEKYEQVKQQVSDNDFQEVKALVVGGSRGVGEITAKLLAAGGAEVTITYYKGESDASKIVDEVIRLGGSIKMLKLNVLEKDFSISTLESLNIGYTHLYYFATPFIFSASKKKFSGKLFNKFNDYYINGFYNLISQMKQESLKAVLYPSTVALDEAPQEMKEYVLSKLAGEQLCEFLEKEMKGIVVYKPRLPRLATDQTMTLSYVENKNTLPEMLNHIKELNNLLKN